MSLAFKEIPKSHIGHANAINNMLFQLTFGMGVAFSALFFKYSQLLSGVIPLDSYQIAILLFTVIALIPMILGMKSSNKIS